MRPELLVKLGLSPSEITIYNHLLSNGADYSNHIARITALNRTNVYEALDRLVSKGLVSFIMRNKVKMFATEKPESLLALVDQRKENLEALRNNINHEISTTKFTAHQSLEANIFVGKKGLRMLFEEMLEIGQPIYLIAAQLQFQKVFGPYFELWHKKREQKKISMYSIFPLSYKIRLKQRPYLQYSFISKINPTTTILYGNNCIFIEWADELLAIRITSPKIVESHRNYFKLLWGKRI